MFRPNARNRTSFFGPIADPKLSEYQIKAENLVKCLERVNSANRKTDKNRSSNDPFLGRIIKKNSGEKPHIHFVHDNPLRIRVLEITELTKWNFPRLKLEYLKTKDSRYSLQNELKKHIRTWKPNSTVENPNLLKHPLFEYSFARYADTFAFACVNCLTIDNGAVLSKGKRKKIGFLHYNRITQMMHGDPANPGNSVHICSVSGEKKSVEKAYNPDKIRKIRKRPIPLLLQFDEKRTPTEEYSSGYSSSSASSPPEQLKFCLEISKEMKWKPGVLPRGKIYHPNSPYIFERTRFGQGYIVYNCTKCLQVAKELKKERKKIFDSYPAIFFVLHKDFAYGDPEKPGNKEHLCKNPNAWDRFISMEKKSLMENKSSLSKTNMQQINSDELEKLLKMSNDEFLKLFHPTKAQIHETYEKEIAPLNIKKDGFLSYVMMESKIFPGVSYLFYQRKIVHDKDLNKKLLYYICMDCWDMHDMEHKEDVPKIVLDENYEIVVSKGGSVDQPRNTRRHYCVKTDELIAARKRWEARRIKLMQDPSIPTNVLSPKIEITEHLEPLAKWLSGKVKNPSFREQVPMGPGKCNGQFCHYCRGDKKAAYTALNGLITNFSSNEKNTNMENDKIIDLTIATDENTFDFNNSEKINEANRIVNVDQQENHDIEMIDLSTTLQNYSIVPNPLPTENTLIHSQPTSKQKGIGVPKISVQNNKKFATSKRNRLAKKIKALQARNLNEEVRIAVLRAKEKSTNKNKPITTTSDVNKKVDLDNLSISSHTVSPNSSTSKATINLTDSSSLSEDDSIVVISTTLTANSTNLSIATNKTLSSPAITPSHTPLIGNNNPAGEISHNVKEVESPKKVSNSSPCQWASFARRSPSKKTPSKVDPAKFKSLVEQFKTLRKMDNLKRRHELASANVTSPFGNQSASAQSKAINKPKETKIEEMAKQHSLSAKISKATVQQTVKNPSIQIPTALLNSSSTPRTPATTILENIISMQEKAVEEILPRNSDMDEEELTYDVDYEPEGCFSPPSSPLKTPFPIQTQPPCSAARVSDTSYSLRPISNIITKENIRSYKQQLEEFEKLIETNMKLLASKKDNPKEKELPVASEQPNFVKIEEIKEENVDIKHMEEVAPVNASGFTTSNELSVQTVNDALTSKIHKIQATPAKEDPIQEKRKTAAKETIEQPKKITGTHTSPSSKVISLDKNSSDNNSPDSGKTCSRKRPSSDSDDEILCVFDSSASKKPEITQPTTSSDDEVQILESKPVRTSAAFHFMSNLHNILSTTPQRKQQAINSRCLVLTNLYDQSDQYKYCEEEIRDDLIAECTDLGGINHVKIDKQVHSGKAYIKCPTVRIAKKAADVLHGRKFYNSSLEVNFIREESYYVIFPEAEHSTKLLIETP